MKCISTPIRNGTTTAEVRVNAHALTNAEVEFYLNRLKDIKRAFGELI